MASNLVKRMDSSRRFTKNAVYRRGQWMISRRRFIAGATSNLSILSFARAQAIERKPRVGVLWHAANIEEETPFFQSLIEGFRQVGYIDGQNIIIDHRFADEKPELFTRMAAELASLTPDVLVGVGAAAPYLKKTTSTIPIVFMYVPDPVAAGLAESVRRPGGNATGLTNFSVELSAKRLQYLKEITPALSRVALLINPNAKISDLYVTQSNEAAPKLGLTIRVFEVRAPDELEPAFDAMVEADIQAVAVNAESLFYKVKDNLAKFSMERRLPTCVWVKEVVEAGALLSYGTDQREIARKVAFYVDRILKGEKPAEMPVEQPARFELIVNLNTANALGLTMPRAVLMLANEVIE
jgi:putative ABC transport system substrate-binding protein